MILVTGASGNIGGEVARQLIDAGLPVRLFVRDPRKVAEFVGRAEIAVGNLDRPETLEAALDGVDGLFLVTVGAAEQDVSASSAARRAGVRRLVKLSTAEAEAGSTQVGRWHRAREQLIASAGVPWTFLRPGQFMSNSFLWAETIRLQSAVFYPNGSDSVAPVDPRDVAAVAVAALTQPGHEGQAYTLTGPELLTISRQVQIIADALGKPIQYVDVPIADARAGLERAGMPVSFIDAMLELMRSIRKGEAAFTTDTVRQVLGRPARPYADWVRDHLAAFRQHDFAHLKVD